MARDRLTARRKALGHSQASLAHAIGADRTTVARWESGRSEVSAHHRRPLAEALQWSLTDLDTALNGSGDLPHADQGWWSNFVTLEQAATSVRSWEPVLVPGLLQTRDYAAALLDANETVQRRLDRQRMVTRPGNPVDLVAVIDESVLHRPIGGRDVLAEQLRHLVAMSERPNVTVQVMPFTAPMQPANWGAMVILGFDWPGGLVYLEHTGGSHSLDSRHEVELHTDTFDQIRGLALSPMDSVGVIISRAMELPDEQ